MQPAQIESDSMSASGSFKNLHDVVLDALSLHASYDLPELDFGPARRRLVVASGNALPTARIVFPEPEVRFLNESSYETVLAGDAGFDASAVVSASGTKHAPAIVRRLLEHGLDPYLLTCAADSPAAELLAPERVIVTRSEPEPVTYNTSTYLGMILTKTREDPAPIRRYLVEEIAPILPDFREYAAFYLMLPSAFEVQCEMFVTKFDELFGGRVNGRCYTKEQTLHAKTVVPWERELFLFFGGESIEVTSNHLAIPLPPDAGSGAMMAAAYFVIGHIQAQFPPWFRDHMSAYMALQPSLFADLEVSRED